MLHPINADGTLDTGEVGVNFYPDDKVHSSWTLLGRATTVVGANKNGEGNNRVTQGESAAETCGEVGDYAIELAPRKDPEDVQWTQEATEDVGSLNDDHGAATTGIDPSVTVSNEAGEELDEEWLAYYQARNDYREAYDNIIKTHNLVLKVSWPETSRPEEWKIIGHAQTLSKDDKFIKGHIPEVKYARDLGLYSTRHIRDFLGLQPDGSPGTRTVRLIVMNRLRPIYDLDGEHFWNAFWQCVGCMRFLFYLQTSAHAIAPGHYRLWVNGIHHGDVSFNNLMYDIPSKTGEPVGIVNDFDLAAWVDHSTTNNDRTGTIPFMAIDLLDGGLNDRTPRLYRHDMESFVWVLAYITVANIEYEDLTIKISPLPNVDAWFRDRDRADRDAHISSKRHFYLEYGRSQEVPGRYYRYLNAVRQITRYWCTFHQYLRAGKRRERPPRPNPKPAQERVPNEPEIDDPAGSLRQFITMVEKSLMECGAEGVTEVKTLLFEAIESPTTRI